MRYANINILYIINIVIRKGKETLMKDWMKNKKVWIGAAIVIIVFAWALWSGMQPPVEEIK
tara:strand:+ start:343 stop:525 length:183 start_codon:yes stop_codon:yes gene_type:complete